MVIYANERSIFSDMFDDYNNIKNICGAYIGLKENNVTACMISSEDYAMIATKLREDGNKRNQLDFFYAFFRAPYEADGAVEENQEEYFRYDWKYDGDTCFGLAMSYIMDTLSLSFDAGKWKEFVSIWRGEEQVSVRNVSERSHVDYYKDWFISQKNVELVETDLAYDLKEIKLRDDHGNDKLLDFSKRLIKDPYVIGIVNSLPFNPKAKSFIHNIGENGVIECVLCWTDAGYGLVVQTTGRNRRETEKIAKILTEKYSK